jgi:ABC-type uncharacterized transport system ATPase subunit
LAALLFEPVGMMICSKKLMSMLYLLGPRIIMLDAGRILFDGTYEAFSHSNSSVIRPYFELMPKLHQRLNGSAQQPNE